jgi:hypothetical protein
VRIDIDERLLVSKTMKAVGQAPKFLSFLCVALSALCLLGVELARVHSRAVNTQLH